MKNLTYILMSLCLVALYSCGMTDVWKDWESEGASNPDRLKPSEIKNMLCAADGWKLNYQGHDFYFQFFEDGTVTANSDTSIEEATTYTTYHFNPQGDKLVALIIDGAGHLSALTSGSEDTYLITAVADNKITATGSNNGAAMNLAAVSATEIEEQMKAKADLLMMLNMKKKGFMNGVIRDADDAFVAHYAISSSENKIRFISLENRVAVHQEADLTIDGSTFAFSGISLNGQSVKKLAYSNAGEGSVRLEGAFGLKVTSNKDAVSYYVSASYQDYAISASENKGDANELLWKELAWENMARIEFSRREGRPIVVCLKNQYGGYLFYWAGESNGDGASSVKFTKDEVDRIYVPKYKVEGLYGGSAEALNEGNRKLENFLATWFGEDGLYVVRESVGSKDYIYFLSPTTENWFKVER